jgi:DNA polymerase-3 subunit alpha
LLMTARPDPERDGPGIPVEIDYRRPDVTGTLRLGDAWRVRLPDELLAGLQRWLGKDAIRIQYAPPPAPAPQASRRDWGNE